MSATTATSTSTSPFEKLLGTTLCTGKDGSEGKINTATAVANKEIVGLYFSGHFCPPCRRFTPILADAYNKINGDKSPLEIVFVSCDRSSDAYTEYYATMPWLALPYQDPIATKLCKKFGVSGVPRLVLLDQNAQVVNNNAVGTVSKDARGFPWRSKTFWQVVADGDELVKKGDDGSLVDLPVSELKTKKFFALYFSAHWCPPCRMFTPKLISTYNKLKESGRNDLEFIFVSLDRSESQFNEYYGTMPWGSFKFQDDRISELSAMFEVQGVPTLIVLDENGAVVTDEGVHAAMNDPDGAEFPWKPKPLRELDSATNADLNNATCFVALLGDNADDKLEVVKQAAAKHCADAEAGAVDPVLFFHDKCSGDTAKRLITVLKLQDGEQFLVLTLPKYAEFTQDVTVENITAFLADVDSLEMKSLQE